MGQHRRFLQRLATVVGRLLGRLFGSQPLSWQAAAVSIFLALASRDLDYAFGSPPNAPGRLEGFVFLAVPILPLVHSRLVAVTVGGLLALLGMIESA